MKTIQNLILTAIISAVISSVFLVIALEREKERLRHTPHGILERLMAHSAEIDRWRPIIQRRIDYLANPLADKDEDEKFWHESIFQGLAYGFADDLVTTLDYVRSGGALEQLPNNIRKMEELALGRRTLPSMQEVDDHLWFFWRTELRQTETP
jgi:hypothetical protein